MTTGFTGTQLDVRAQDYSKIILPLARQEKSMLFDKVYVKNGFVGKSFYQDQIGKWSMTMKTTSNPTTPENDPNLARTRVDIATYNDARLMDRSLLLQELSDPMNAASVCIQSSVGVQIDKIIYDALGANALRGETGANAIALPAKQIIGANFETAGGLTTAKIRKAAELLNAAGVPHGERTFVTSAAGLSQLLGTTEVTSSDYNTVKTLVNGELNTWLGFNFVILPDGVINKTEAGVADYYAFHKTGICFGMLEELFLRMEERADKSYSKQIFYEISAGAGRLEEEKVVKIQCDETEG
jgi:hypothetical protein